MLKYFLILNLLFAGSLIHCSQPKTYGTKRGNTVYTDLTVPKSRFPKQTKSFKPDSITQKYANVTTRNPRQKQKLSEKQLSANVTTRKPKKQQQQLPEKLSEKQLADWEEKYTSADKTDLKVESLSEEQIQAQKQEIDQDQTPLNFETRFTFSKWLTPAQINKILYKQSFRTAEEYNAYLKEYTKDILSQPTPPRSTKLISHLIPLYEDPAIYGTPMPTKGKK